MSRETGSDIAGASFLKAEVGLDDDSWGKPGDIPAPDLPARLPSKTRRLTFYRLRPEEVLDYVANERLRDRLSQAFMGMPLETTSNPRQLPMDMCLLSVFFCRCSVKMSSPRGYQSRRARERKGPRAEGVPSGAGAGVERFCDVAAAVGCPPNTSCRSSLWATQLGGDTFTDQLEG